MLHCSTSSVRLSSALLPRRSWQDVTLLKHEGEAGRGVTAGVLGTLCFDNQSVQSLTVRALVVSDPGAATLASATASAAAVFGTAPSVSDAFACALGSLERWVTVLHEQQLMASTHSDDDANAYHALNLSRGIHVALGGTDGVRQARVLKLRLYLSQTSPRIENALLERVTVRLPKTRAAVQCEAGHVIYPTDSERNIAEAVKEREELGRTPQNGRVTTIEGENEVRKNVGALKRVLSTTLQCRANAKEERGMHVRSEPRAVPAIISQLHSVPSAQAFCKQSATQDKQSATQDSGSGAIMYVA